MSEEHLISREKIIERINKLREAGIDDTKVLNRLIRSLIYRYDTYKEDV